MDFPSHNGSRLLADTRSALWILDEPFTALDQSAIAALTARIAEHCSQGGAVLLTSHQPVQIPGHTVREFLLEYRW